jgi:hypothetical protein
MSVALASSASAVVLDLSVVPLGNFTTPVNVGEYVLTPRHLGSADPTIQFINGIYTLGGTDFSSGSDTFLTRADGQAFTLVSVDIGLVDGYTQGQGLGTVTVGYGLNGVANSSALQTITFGSTFAGITSIDLDETVGPYYANITVSQPDAVPEPAAWTMMVVGFGLVGTAIRGRKSTIVTA